MEYENVILTGIYKRSVLVIIFLFLILIASKAQEMVFLHKSLYNTPFFVCIVSEEVYDEFLEKVKENHSSYNYNFLVINGTSTSKAAIKDKINQVLNDKTLLVSKTKVYLGIIGDNRFFNEQNVFTNDFFPDQFFLTTESFSNQVDGFKTFQYTEVSLNDVFVVMKKEYLWETEKSRIENLYYSDYNLSKVEKGIGAGLSLNNNNSIRYSGYESSRFITYGITGYRRISEDWKIYGNLFMSFKIPNMKKIMQEEMQDQVDISSLSSGDDVTFHVNTDIHARIYSNVNIEARKFFLSDKYKIKPYAGTGLSYSFYLDMEGTFDTTITVNPSSMRSGGGMSFGGGGFSQITDGNNENINTVDCRGFGMIFSTGFEYPLSQNAFFNAKLAYHLPFNTFNQNVATTNCFDFQLGLVFKLNGKKIRFVEYVRLK